MPGLLDRDRVVVDAVVGYSFRVKYLYGFADHDRWTGEVSVGTGSRRDVFVDDQLDKACLAFPLIAGRRIRQGRDVMKLRFVSRPFLEAVMPKQISATSYAEEKPDLVV